MLSTLVNPHHIKINLSATTKDELFQELVDVLHANNRISDKAQFLADIQQRESDSITCMDGIAYPHAKSKAVLEPAIAVGIKKETIAYGDEDGVEPSLFFMIASPDNGADHHIYVLQELFGKFGDEFLEAMHNATSEQQALDVLLSDQFS
ncbi:PTS fructose transporter subunit IIA [Photobacterium leiognathi subsp. mandapamensis]|uniref:PTS sugar transporter subunit IIA n=1 Tax=Photobacterium leiognathi TaxID=553611 RepID=UPI0006B43A05|nr:PTS sugar transporter subunit IIA [Photobacterium leiognathi]KPA51414.1 PTS fructose transporter subunit IIA [Photobacterium leiognathi subsp. mandapamensis]